MAERSFAREVQSLRLGRGTEFRGEGILAVTKSYCGRVWPCPGAREPPFLYMDVLADAEGI
jgi:indolepyruvate ferredoxin oxidoreductase alpha subunit